MTTLTQAATALAVTRFPRVYDQGTVPKVPVYPYAVVSGWLGRGDSYAADSTHGVRWGRVAVQVFGKSLDEADRCASAVVDALLDHSLAFTYRGAEVISTTLRISLDPTSSQSAADGGIEGLTLALSLTIGGTS